MLKLTTEMVNVLKELHVLKCTLEYYNNNGIVNIKDIILANNEKLSPTIICKLLDTNFNVQINSWTFVKNENDDELITIFNGECNIESTVSAFKSLQHNGISTWFWIKSARHLTKE